MCWFNKRERTRNFQCSQVSILFKHRFGSVLENIEYTNKDSREVDYHNISITENTRVSYPLDFIPGAKDPAVGGHPKNILFLTCDAYGVLPPVALLNPE